MHKITGRLSTWCRCRKLKEIRIQANRSQQALRCLHSSRTDPRGTRKERNWYSDVMPQWNTREQLVEDLASNVLYEDRNILALNKPNGLPMHALRYTENLPLDIAPPDSAELSIVSSLPDLADRLGTPELKPIYSQNRLYSGVLILTKNESASTTLQKYFRHTRAQKVSYQHFWALTVGIPQDQTKICEMALQKQIVNGWRLSVLDPNASQKNRQAGKAVRFTMEHSVEDFSKKYDCALVGLRPTATKWDFLEFYLVQQLCVALGDHVYSPRVRTIMGKPVLVNPQSSYPAPQVLPNYILKPLGLGKNTFDIPSHIHCHRVDIPVIKNQRAVITSIKAPLPDFFRKTLNLLDLRCPIEKAKRQSEQRAEM